jgi:hypothetical protein
MEKDWGMVRPKTHVEVEEELIDRPAGFDEPAAPQPEVQEITEDSDEERSLQGDAEDQEKTEDR